jgi:uncharacterized protein (TIGR01777 family)
MKLVIAGGSGFLGRPLVDHFTDRKFQVVVLTRKPRPASNSPLARDEAWRPVEAPDPATLDGWAREIDGADAVINLAGAGLADRRWSAQYKRELLRSRTVSTRNLVAAVRAASKRPAVFVQGSAIGYYGTNPNHTFDESFPPGDDFLGRMCVAWEAEAHPVTALGSRLVILRSGIALAADGGALQQMARPFKFFVGGPFGNGSQTISWIHRDDWIALVDWAIETTAISGPLNATAPEPVTGGEMSSALGHALHRPNWLAVPGFALRVIVGEMAQVALLQGQRVVPERARKQGFVFRYPDLDSALAAIYGG